MSDDFDHIIDDVAHEMTSTPSGSGFVERVQRRVTAAEATRRSMWTRPALLAPFAAACVLMAAFVMRNRTPPVELVLAPAVNISSVPPVAKRNDEQAVAVTKIPTAAVRAAAAPRVAPPPLPAIEVPPVEIERLEVAPIVRAQQQEIEIDPIAIARIEISPMP